MLWMQEASFLVVCHEPEPVEGERLDLSIDGLDITEYMTKRLMGTEIIIPSTDGRRRRTSSQSSTELEAQSSDTLADWLIGV